MTDQSPSSGRGAPLAFVAAALILLFLLAACGKGGEGHNGAFPPPAVAIQEAKARPVKIEFEYPAQTAGSREVEVRARVTGILQSRNYTEGANVRAGQSLFTIDPAQFQAAVARAEADVAAAEARLAAASRQVKRLRPVYEAKAASQKDFDDATSGEEIAAADVKAATARLKEARLNLEDTKVEAPVSGMTSRALKSEGSLVSGPDVLLTTVSQVDPIYVNFGLPEAEQARLRADAAAGTLVLPKDGRFDVAVRFEDGRVYARPGKLAFSDARVNTATGTLDARAEVPNPDGAIRAGQFVRVVLKGAERPAAITVPQRAVMEGPQGKMVYVLGAGNKAEARPVTVGEWAGEDWIIATGLKAGEKVITEGLMKVFPGAVVQVGDAPPPGAPGQAPPKADDKKPAAKPDDKKK